MKVFIPDTLKKKGINLIPAFSSHVPDILPMMKEFYGLFEYEFVEERAREILREFILEPQNGRLWLIRESENLIGYVGLAFSFSFGYGKTGLLDEFFITEKFRSKGVGRQVMELVISEAKEMGLKSINLEVEKDNIIAKNLYENLGFELSKYEWHQKILN